LKRYSRGFTDELQKEWEKFEPEFLKVKEWIAAGLKPEEFSLASYIKDFHINREGWEIINVKENLDEFRKYFFEEEEEDKVEISEEDWIKIDSNFTPELIQEWEDCDFDLEEVKDWINSGMKINDTGFCAWLRDEVKVNSDWVLDEGDCEELRSQYQEYLLVNQQVHNPQLDN
jgi:ribosomal protein S16